MASRARLQLGLAAGVAAVSSAAILVRLAGAPPLSVAAWRLLFASAPALLFAAWRRRHELRALGGRERLLLAGAGVALALHFATWIASLGLTSVASSVALVTTQPVWVALFARLALRERAGLRTAAGIGLSALGSAAVSGADLSADPEALLGDGLALAGAIFGALYFVAGRRVRPRLSLGGYVGVVYPTAALVLVALAAGAGQPLRGFSSRSWLLLALLGLLPQLVGHSLLNWSLRWLSAPFVAVVILAEPIIATLLAIPILGERPGPLLAAGAALTLGGVFLAATGEARPVRAEAAPG